MHAASTPHPEVSSDHGYAEHTSPAPQGPATAAASGATKHAAPPPGLALPIILNSHGLKAARRDQGPSKEELHDSARDALNTFANAVYAGPKNLDGLFPWKRYLALHGEGRYVVGPGICRAVVDLIPEQKYANQNEGPQADFIFTRLDGSAYRIHVGPSSTNESKTVYYPNSGSTEQIDLPPILEAAPNS